MDDYNINYYFDADLRGILGIGCMQLGDIVDAYYKNMRDQVDDKFCQYLNPNGNERQCLECGCTFSVSPQLEDGWIADCPHCGLEIEDEECNHVVRDEIIECPDCEAMCKATITHKPYWSLRYYNHTCEHCGYAITLREWMPVIPAKSQPVKSF